MIHHALPEFWECYQALPECVQKLADKNFELLKAQSDHPSLHFKRVGIGYRALARDRADGIYWFWIDSHAEYDKLLG